MILKTRRIEQRRNDKDWPSFYECNFLEPGAVDYSDSGAGLSYLSKETILKMLPTFMGKPVIDEMHVDVSPDTYKKHAVGYITKVWFDDYANWAKCQFILTDDKAKANVARGYSVSCAYDNVKTIPGVERNAVRYDEEIIDGAGNHLALVTSPRYESCEIQPCMMLVNSKRATIRKNEVTVKVANAIKRICNTCEYLVQGKCEVAGPGGEISQRYADARILGQIQECSAYERAGERRENLVTVRVAK